MRCKAWRRNEVGARPAPEASTGVVARLASRRPRPTGEVKGLQVATDSCGDRAEARNEFIKNCRQ